MQERQHTSEPVTPHALTSALCRAARVKESKSQSQGDRPDWTTWWFCNKHGQMRIHAVRSETPALTGWATFGLFVSCLHIQHSAGKGTAERGGELRGDGVGCQGSGQ